MAIPKRVKSSSKSKVENIIPELKDKNEFDNFTSNSKTSSKNKTIPKKQQKRTKVFIVRSYSIRTEDEENIETILDSAARAGVRGNKSDAVRAGILLLKELGDNEKIAEAIRNLKNQ